MPSGSVYGTVPGFQKRKWLSGSKASDSILISIPANPAPGEDSCKRADCMRSTKTFA